MDRRRQHIRHCEIFRREVRCQHVKQRGMTLVELMVGLAVGLFVVSMALGMAVGQFRDDRTLLQDSRLVIALEMATDLVTHDLRRAGYRGDAGAGIARSATAAIANPYAGVSWADASATLLMTYSRDEVEDDVVESNEQFGFRLRSGVIEMMVGGGSWQAVTDAGTMTVTTFSITPVVQDVALGSFCEQPCPATDASCPRQQVWRYDVVLSGRSTAEPTVTHEMRSSVRIRNDTVTGTCPT